MDDPRQRRALLETGRRLCVERGLAVDRAWAQRLMAPDWSDCATVGQRIMDDLGLLCWRLSTHQRFCVLFCLINETVMHHLDIAVEAGDLAPHPNCLGVYTRPGSYRPRDYPPPPWWRERRHHERAVPWQIVPNVRRAGQ